MNIVQIDNWRDYHRHGEQFLNTACGAYSKKKKTFTADTIYNLTCMAIEKLIMAYLMKNGDLAENHTMGDLLRALQLHLGELPELAGKLRYMDTFQEICDIDTFTIHLPTDEDIRQFLQTGEQVRDHLAPLMHDNAGPSRRHS
jgi:hypothetical protein